MTLTRSRPVCDGCCGPSLGIREVRWQLRKARARRRPVSADRSARSRHIIRQCHRDLRERHADRPSPERAAERCFAHRMRAIGARIKSQLIGKFESFAIPTSR